MPEGRISRMRGVAASAPLRERSCATHCNVCRPDAILLCWARAPSPSLAQPRSSMSGGTGGTHLGRRGWCVPCRAGRFAVRSSGCSSARASVSPCELAATSATFAARELPTAPVATSGKRDSAQDAARVGTAVETLLYRGFDGGADTRTLSLASRCSHQGEGGVHLGGWGGGGKDKKAGVSAYARQITIYSIESLEELFIHLLISLDAFQLGPRLSLMKLAGQRR